MGQIIVHYGLPEKILLDQGQNFESQLVADLCTLLGTQRYGSAHTIHKLMANVRGTIPL